MILIGETVIDEDVTHDLRWALEKGIEHGNKILKKLEDESFDTRDVVGRIQSLRNLLRLTSPDGQIDGVAESEVRRSDPRQLSLPVEAVIAPPPEERRAPNRPTPEELLAIRIGHIDSARIYLEQEIGDPSAWGDGQETAFRLLERRIHSLEARLAASPELAALLPPEASTVLEEARRVLEAMQPFRPAPAAADPDSSESAGGEEEELAIAAALECARLYSMELVSGNLGPAQAWARDVQDAAIRLHGGRLGSADTLGRILERGRAADGTVPHWGQRGRFKVVVDGVPALVEHDPFSISPHHFEFFALDREHSISETGYRSLHVHPGLSDDLTGKTVDQVAAALIAERVAEVGWLQVKEDGRVADLSVLDVASEWVPDPELLREVRQHKDYSWVRNCPASDGNFKTCVQRSSAELLQAVLMEIRGEQGQRTRAKAIEAQLKRIGASLAFPRTRGSAAAEEAAQLRTALQGRGRDVPARVIGGWSEEERDEVRIWIAEDEEGRGQVLPACLERLQVIRKAKGMWFYAESDEPEIGLAREAFVAPAAEVEA